MDALAAFADRISPCLLHHPFRGKCGGARRTRRAALQNGADEIFDTGEMQIGVWRNGLRAAGPHKFRTVEGSEIELPFCAADTELVSRRPCVPSYVDQSTNSAGIFDHDGGIVF